MTPLLAFILLVLSAGFSLSNTPVVSLNNEREKYVLPITELPVYIDSLGEKSFEDIQQTHQNDFTIYHNFRSKDYCTTCSYWVKVPIQVADHLEKQWIVEFYDQTIDYIEAYFPVEGGGYLHKRAGDRLFFSEKDFMHKNFEWIVNTNIKDGHILYFKVSSHSYADIRVAFKTVNRFVYYSLNEYFAYGVFYGMIFIFTLYNLQIFLAIRERRYLYYAFYIVSVGVYAMCIDGIAYQYLWPKWPEWNQIAHGASLYALIFWALLFSKHFLNTSKRAPKLNKAINLAITVRTLWFLYVLFFDHQLFDYRNIEIIPLSLIFYTGITVLMRGYKPARFFVLAYGILFTGFLIKALILMAVIPFTILSHYSLHICFLLEMIFLTFALSERVRLLKANRDRALRRTLIQHQENAKLNNKVNKELEEKIVARTKELEEKNLMLAATNQRLFEQTNEINRINSMLDLDNWKLKNNMKELLQDRLADKSLTIEQFRAVFPDQLACYRFLERLKWESGYECSKCENTKYSEGNSKFARRCTKCGYNESITSNTIFHRIKFPIEKAFFILYATKDPRQQLTLDQLSELLDLRRATVWGFKKKIEKHYSDEAQGAAGLLMQSLITHHH